MVQVTSDTLLSLIAQEGSSPSPWLRNANRVVVAVGLAVSTSALIMRIYTKARIMKKFWWDDVMILMAWSILAISFVYLFTLAFAKLALLMLYYRLLHVIRAWEYTIYALAFIVIGYTLGEALVIIFACSPIQKNWDVTINGSCINRPVLYLMTTITNTTSDVVLILVPLHIVWGLRLPLIQKIGVAFLLGLGSL
ncbi:hypothetical protein N7513_009440 [Penicillium frequentans]|nr:hypothetical protein N7513_009440 [Penicillium glabrum]